MSLDDYAKFLRLFIQDQENFLGRSSKQRLITPLGRGPAYAVGWLVEDLPWAGGRALVHDGSNTMWYATAVVGLESGIASVAAANEGTEKAARATHALARDLLQQAT